MKNVQIVTLYTRTEQLHTETDIKTNPINAYKHNYSLYIYLFIHLC